MLKRTAHPRLRAREVSDRSVPVPRYSNPIPYSTPYIVYITGEGKKKKKKKKPKKKKLEQTEPPTIGLTKLFPDGKFPEGELQEYKNE